MPNYYANFDINCTISSYFIYCDIIDYHDIFFDNNREMFFKYRPTLNYQAVYTIIIQVLE